MLDCTGYQNLSNPTHQGTRKCVGLYRMSEPVLSDTPRDQGNVSDCTGCWNTQRFFLVNRKTCLNERTQQKQLSV